MGIILGALGGMGEAMQGVGKSMLQDSFEADKEQRTAALAQQTHAANSQIDLQRQQALEDYKLVAHNREREAQVGRINTAASGIVGNAINQKYAGSDAAVAAAAGGASPEVSAAEGNDNVQAALTPQQQAVIDQSKASDRAAMIADPKTRMTAAIQTGDISPEKAATLGNSAEINQMKMESLLARAEDRNQTMKEVADIRAEATTAAAQLRVDAANQRALTGKIDTATGRMLITSEDVNIKAATSQIGTLNRELISLDAQVKGPDGKRIPNPAIASIKEQMDSLRADIKASQANKSSYLKSMGLMSDETGSAPAPSRSPYTDGGTAADALPEQIRVMQGELNDPKTSETDRAGIRREMDRLRNSTPIATPRPAASSARPPLSSFLK